MKSRSSPRAELRRARPLLGTLVEIAVPASQAAPGALERAFAAIARVQALMSAHDPQSDLGRLHAAAPGTPVAVHPWTWRVLAAARDLHRASGGFFDPIAAGRLAVAVGRLPRWHGAPDRRASWDDLELRSRSRVVTHRRLRLDLGGIAKGFAVDQAVRALRAAGVRSGLVNAGGDVRAFGARGRPLHVRHPGAPGRLLPAGVLHEGAAATSAPYFSMERTAAGRPRSALIDPRSGRSVTGAISVTVFARTCLVADALTKVVLCSDAPDEILRACGARAFILSASEAASLAA